jgi:hypothetical protein
VRGGDLSCKAETGSSSGKLVGDAATRPRDRHAFPEMHHQVKGALLQNVAVSKGTAILKLLASGQWTPP